MKDQDGCKRGFHWTTKAWYAEANGNPNEISFGNYADEGGTSGEMTMKWIKLGGKLTPQLRSFDYSWAALSSFGDLINELGKHDSDGISQERFVDILTECGFKDLTSYESPYDPPETALRKRLAVIENEADEIRSKLNPS